MIKLKEILKEDKYDSKKAMEFYGALQSMLLNLKQQSDPRASDNRDVFKKVHTGLQLLKATSYHNEAKKYGQDYIKVIKNIMTRYRIGIRKINESISCR